MSSSMLLSAEDLARGEINTQSETWVKAGRSFAVPIRINTPYTVVSWEFTVQPKVGVCVWWWWVVGQSVHNLLFSLSFMPLHCG